MIVIGPPDYPETRIIPSFNHDSAHNRRELDACALKALELQCDIHLPIGEWPIDAPTVTGDR